LTMQAGPIQIDFYERRRVRLLLIGFGSYRSYLTSSLWKTIRDRVLAEWPRCRTCNRPAKQVHHQDYKIQTLLGSVREGLIALCSRCHRKVEFYKSGGKRSFAGAHTVCNQLLCLRDRRLASCSECGGKISRTVRKRQKKLPEQYWRCGKCWYKNRIRRGSSAR
jgi:hypothetical protein